MYTSGKSSSLSCSEKFNDLFSGEFVDLFRSVTSEWIFLKSLFFLLNCGHYHYKIIIFYKILIFISTLIIFILLKCKQTYTFFLKLISGHKISLCYFFSNAYYWVNLLLFFQSERICSKCYNYVFLIDFKCFINLRNCLSLFLGLKNLESNYNWK